MTNDPEVRIPSESPDHPDSHALDSASTLRRRLWLTFVAFLVIPFGLALVSSSRALPMIAAVAIILSIATRNSPFDP